MHIMDCKVNSLFLHFQGRRLLVIGTTSRKDALQDMDMLASFSHINHVSNLTSSEHLLAALEDLQDFTQPELQRLGQKTDGKR